jgi:ADA HAT complex component 1
MISDLEDDDHGSASEEETSMPPSSRGPMLPVNTASRTCADNNAMDLDVAVDDEIDEHGVIIRRNSMLGSDDRTHQRNMASTASPSKLG